MQQPTPRPSMRPARCNAGAQASVTSAVLDMYSESAPQNATMPRGCMKQQILGARLGRWVACERLPRDKTDRKPSMVWCFLQ